MRRRLPFTLAAFVLLGAFGACFAWMGSPPQPPNRPTYEVCRATGFHGWAQECGPSFEPPGKEPGTFAPGQGPQPAPSTKVPATAHGTSTDDTTPQFQGTPDLGPADVGPADAGAGDGYEPGGDSD